MRRYFYTYREKVLGGYILGGLLEGLDWKPLECSRTLIPTNGFSNCDSMPSKDGGESLDISLTETHPQYRLNQLGIVATFIVMWKRSVAESGRENKTGKEEKSASARQLRAWCLVRGACGAWCLWCVVLGLTTLHLPMHGLWLTNVKTLSQRFFMWLFGQMQPNIGEYRILVQASWHASLQTYLVITLHPSPQTNLNQYVQVVRVSAGVTDTSDRSYSVGFIRGEEDRKTTRTKHQYLRSEPVARSQVRVVTLTEQ